MCHFVVSDLQPNIPYFFKCSFSAGDKKSFDPFLVKNRHLVTNFSPTFFILCFEKFAEANRSGKNLQKLIEID